MNPEKFCIDQSESIKNAMKFIDITGYGICFVVDKNEFKAAITDSDIRRAILDGMSIEKPILAICNKTSITLPYNWSTKDTEKIRKRYKKFPFHGTLIIPVLKDKQVVDIISLTRDGKIEKDLIPLQVRRVLIIGGAGYLGSILSRELLSLGYKVRVLDCLLYGDDGIKELYDNKDFEFIKGDIRDITTVMDCLKSVDAVIHLAAIVGDPASSIHPQNTIEVNYLATKLIAEACKFSQINRLVFASTCSVYGNSNGIQSTEFSNTNPLSLYASMKLKSEQALLELADENFSPTILRLSTLFGVSPRMRFDLVINILAANAFYKGEFTVDGGDQYRPFLPLKDAARAFIACIEADIDIVKDKIYNVGLGSITLSELGDIITKEIDSKMIVDTSRKDKRSYVISNSKFEKELNFKIEHTIKEGVVDLKTEMLAGKYKDYMDKKYSNEKYLNEESH